MPVIRAIASNPADLVIQGEKFRMAALAAPVNAQWPMIDDPPEDLPLAPMVLVAGLQTLSPMTGGEPTPNVEVIRSPFAGSMIRNNAVISTPCGALIPFEIGRRTMSDFVGAATLYALSGVTRDNAGVALGNCRVVCLEVGRIAVGAAQAVVAETMSDGAGSFTIATPGNAQYQLIAYKSGSPDVAGISLSTLQSTAVG